MRIAQIVSTFPPYRGGMGDVVFQYSLNLAKLGHEVTVLTPRRKSEEADFCNFKIRGLKSFIKFGNASFSPHLLKDLKDFDIIHLHYPFFGSTEIVWFWKKLFGKNKKLIITYHMDFVARNLFFRIFSWPSRLITPSLFKMADKILVSSYDYGRSSDISQLMEKYKNKFVELPFGVDKNVFYPEPANQDKINKYDLKGKKVLLFISALDSAHLFKGLDYLLSAVARINDRPVKLLVVGKGNRQQYFEKRAEALGLASRTHFFGFVAEECLNQIINLCDLFVLPSFDKSEAFGLVYLRAMACKKPVIAGNLPGVRTVVQSGVNGLLVEPRSVDDLVDKIKIILDNDKLARNMGEEGFKITQEKYNWEKIIKKLAKIYENLFNS